MGLWSDPDLITGDDFVGCDVALVWDKNDGVDSSSYIDIALAAG